MKKPLILLLSIIISLVCFVVLLYTFKNVSDFIVSKYDWNYIEPSAKDSTYTDLLMDTLQRPKAVQLSNELFQFYTISDSIKTILEAELDLSLKTEIIVNKQLAAQVKNELQRFDEDSIINCPKCLDSIYYNTNNWNHYFLNHNEKEIEEFINHYINKVEKAEHQKLKEILNSF